MELKVDNISKYVDGKYDEVFGENEADIRNVKSLLYVGSMVLLFFLFL